MIKRGRKYGVVLLLATQSPTKDSLPREVTRNIACGVAFSVADHVANDGLLGSGRYATGIRATELRMHADRGTCVAVGLSDATSELVRTFYVRFEDGADDVTPVIERAMRLLTARGQFPPTERLELVPAPRDHLVDIAEVMRGERRVRTQVVLARLAELNPAEYEGWTFSMLASALAEHDVTPRKSDGVKVVRAEDVKAAIDREQARDREDVQGDVPGEPPRPHPWSDLQRSTSGTHLTAHRNGGREHGNGGRPTVRRTSLPEDS